MLLFLRGSSKFYIHIPSIHIVAGYKGWTEVSKGEALPPYFGDIPGAADPYNSGTSTAHSLSIT